MYKEGMKRTKIVCTLGPASRSLETIKALANAGMNVARLNFSHSNHSYHQETIERIKQVREELGLPIAILLDTKGPEIRVKEFKDGQVELTEGQTFTFSPEISIGDNTKAGISFSDLYKNVKVGTKIVLDDGNLELKVEKIENKDVICSVTIGGILKNTKSLNVPCTVLDIPYLSAQDKEDILFGIQQDVDFIAASFTRCEQDVIDLQNFLDFNGGHEIKIIAKIENHQGIENFDSILEAADGIMVARGDMGVEVDYERLPGLQKRFIKQCYQHGKMVITATQMLESMIEHPKPTRAEITDVANAVFDGTSAVMLSGETAVGKFPVKTVQTMVKIVTQAESDAFEMGTFQNIFYSNNNETTNAISDAACTTAKDLDAKAIIALTKSGRTARRISKYRPHSLIIAATPSIKTFHQLALSWGVFPVLSRVIGNSDELFIHAIDCAKTIGLVKEKDKVVIVAGLPLDISGNTNILKVEVVGHRGRKANL